MFPCRADREGRAVLLVYRELTSTPVSVTCSSLLDRKAQARQETRHVQARCVLSACACHSCVLGVCVCTLGFSLQRRRDLTHTRETEARRGPGPSQVRSWFRPGRPSPDCFLQGALLTCHHTQLQVREFTLPWAVLSLQKDILKTSTVVVSTLPPTGSGSGWWPMPWTVLPGRVHSCSQGGTWLRNQAPSPSPAIWSLVPGGRDPGHRPESLSPKPLRRHSQDHPPHLEPEPARATVSLMPALCLRPESAPQVPAAGAPAGHHPSGKL